MKKLFFILLLVSIFFGQDSLGISLFNEWTFPDSLNKKFKPCMEIQNSKLLIGDYINSYMLDISNLDSIAIAFEIDDNYDYNSDLKFFNDSVFVVHNLTNITFYSLSDSSYKSLKSNDVEFSQNIFLSDFFLCTTGSLSGLLNVYSIDSLFELERIDSILLFNPYVQDLQKNNSQFILSLSNPFVNIGRLCLYDYNFMDSLSNPIDIKTIQDVTHAIEIYNDTILISAHNYDKLLFHRLFSDSISTVMEWTDTLLHQIKDIEIAGDTLYLGAQNYVYGLNISNLDSIYSVLYYEIVDSDLKAICIEDSFIYCFCKPENNEDSLSLKILEIE